MTFVFLTKKMVFTTLPMTYMHYIHEQQSATGDALQQKNVL